ncbi:MAG: Outer membrane protein W [Stenotrophomonas maltophilia]|uniref:Outer membrane protein W n=1 Tax=Stenotrophomonas maltophilia TaxID=40324 RepID=A0A7V8JLI6_STEMA|nr:MAG: Outer membrane protein W [Stenotrophomonas maltophilia]
MGAADKFGHKVNGVNGARLGNVEQQPVALSGQYHFGQADNAFRPFMGLGYYQSSFSGESLANGADTDYRLKDAKGVIGTVGVDMNINSTWFARADARYMRARPDLKLAGETVGEAKLDPWTVGFGIGARF